MAVATPGTNAQRYRAGSIHGRTGRGFLSEGLPKEGRSAAWCGRHLDDLRRAFRHDQVIPVVGATAGPHRPAKSRLVKE